MLVGMYVCVYTYVGTMSAPPSGGSWATIIVAG